RTGLDIYISGNDELHLETYNIINKGSKKELARLALPVQEGEEYIVLIEEKQINNTSAGIARISGYIIIVEEAGSLVEQEVKIIIRDVYRTFARAELV
ncbi:MAG: TRAM domain-containing protein, partial [Halanaerobiales bacterium]